MSRRGVALREVNQETQDAINVLAQDMNVQSITVVWNQLVSTAFWNKKPVWVHGDLLPGNILINNNRLSAVIDFSDVGIGDPACDLIIAWSLFNKPSRKIFKENLVDIDENTWNRGKGWALSIALIMLPYYRDTNPVLISLAEKIIKNVLDE